MEQVPENMRDEIVDAIRKVKAGKAAGMDSISAEAFRHNIIAITYGSSANGPETEQPPLLFPYIKHIGKCGNYRIISFITNISKIML